jgi:hypothetical protein
MAGTTIMSRGIMLGGLSAQRIPGGFPEMVRKGEAGNTSTGTTLWVAVRQIRTPITSAAILCRSRGVEEKHGRKPKRLATEN